MPKTRRMLAVETAFDGSIEDLLKGWRDQGLSTRNIAAKVFTKGVKVTSQSVGNWLRRLDEGDILTGRPKTTRMLAVEAAFDGSPIEALLQKWHDQGLSLRDIMVKISTKGVGVSHQDVANWMKKAGVSTENPSIPTISGGLKTEAMRDLEEALGWGDIHEELQRLYCEQGWSAADIFDLVDGDGDGDGIVTGDTIRRWLREWDLLRSVAEAGRQERRNRKLSQAKRAFYRNPAARVAGSERAKAMWRRRKEVLEACQEKVDRKQSPSSKVTLTCEEEAIIVGLAKCKNEQARALLILAYLYIVHSVAGH